MGNIAECALNTAKTLAHNKERAIKTAIDQYFEGKPWTEEDVSCLAKMEIYKEGDEIFTMGDKQLLLFYPIISTTEITGNSVVCSYSQNITVLNGGDNDS